MTKSLRYLFLSLLSLALIFFLYNRYIARSAAAPSQLVDSTDNNATAKPSQRKVVRTTNGSNGNRVFAVAYDGTTQYLYYSDNADASSPTWNSVSIIGSSNNSLDMVWDETNNVLYLAYGFLNPSNSNSADIIYKQVTNLGGTPTVGTARIALNGTAGSTTYSYPQIAISKDLGTTKVFVFGNASSSGGNPNGWRVAVGTINSDNPTWTTYSAKTWTATAAGGLVGVSRTNSDRLTVFYYNGTDMLATRHDDDTAANATSGWDALDGTDNSQTTISTDDLCSRGGGSIVGMPNSNAVWFSWQDSSCDLNTRRWNGSSLDTEMTPAAFSANTFGPSLSSDGNLLYLIYQNPSDSTQLIYQTRSATDGSTAWSGTTTLLDDVSENIIYPSTSALLKQGKLDVVYTTETSSLVRHVSSYRVSGNIYQDSQSWYNTSWSYRLKLTIDHNQVAGDLTDFPLYLDLSTLPSSFHSHVNQTDARDLRITKGDGTTELPREVVFYNSSTDTGEVHVKYSGTLSSTTDTDLYLYYGNAGASDYAATDTYGRNNVWSNSYAAVLHFQETSGSHVSSVGNTDYNTTAISVTNQGTATGKMGGADNYVAASSNYLTFNNAPDHPLDDFTVEVWAKPDIIDGTLVSDSDWGESGYRFTPWTNGVNAILGDGAEVRIARNPPVTTNMQYFLFTYNNPSVNIFHNGNQVGTTGTFTGPLLQSGDSLFIGKTTSTNWYFDGIIDEYRFSTVDRSSTWVKTQHNNQSGNTTFYSHNSEESYPPPVKGITPWSGCDGSTANVAVSIAGGTKVTTSCKQADGSFSFVLPPPAATDADITVFLDTGGGHHAALFTHNSSVNTDVTGLTLYKDYVTIHSDSSTSITNADINSFDQTNDADIPIASDGTNVTVDTGIGLYILTGKTYAPGGNVSTPKLHLKGTYTGGSETLTISGSGTSSSCDDTLSNLRPLCLDSGTFTPTSNTTLFTGPLTSLIPATTYNHLRLEPSGNGITHTIMAGTLATNNLTLGNGTNTSVTLTSATNATTVTVSGNLTLSGNTTFIANGSSATSVAGNWSNSGTFTHSSGTVQLTGGDSTTQTLSGDTTFYNLSASTAGNSLGRTLAFTGSSTTTVSGAFTIAGATGKVLTLQSTNTNSWTINPTTATVDYATVSRSNSGLALCATHSTDGGNNNANWSFTAGTSCNSAPSTPALDSPLDTATNVSLTPTLSTTTTDANSDYLRYKIELCENLGMTTNCQTFDQTASQTGWSGQNTQTSTAYTSGTQGSYTLQTPLAYNTTYYWRSYAIDPAGTNSWSATQGTPYSFTTLVAPGNSSLYFQGVNFNGVTLY